MGGSNFGARVHQTPDREKGGGEVSGVWAQVALDGKILLINYYN